MTIKIYSTPYCVYCKMAKDFFTKKGLPYEEIDVSGNEAALQEMVNKSHQLGVPVIEIDGNIFVGFNRTEIEKTLENLDLK